MKLYFKCLSKQNRKSVSCRVCLNTLSRAAAGQMSFSSFTQVNALLLNTSENLRLVEIGFCKEVQTDKDTTSSIWYGDSMLVQAHQQPRSGSQRSPGWSSQGSSRADSAAQAERRNISIPGRRRPPASPALRFQA